MSAQNPSFPLDSYITFNGGNGILYVAISDSNNIAEIEVQLGSSENISDLFSHSFLFDHTNGLPTGLSYSRTNLNVNLGIGQLQIPSAYYVQVRTKSSSGIYSSWFNYLTN